MNQEPFLRRRVWLAGRLALERRRLTGPFQAAAAGKVPTSQGIFSAPAFAAAPAMIDAGGLTLFS